MADYKNIIGKPLKLVSTNLDNDQAEGQIWYNSSLGQFKDVIVRSAWASAAPVVSGRNQTAAAGTQDASILFGGKEGPPPNADTGTTQEYNGSGWSNGGDMTDARYELGGAGTQTAGLAFGGIDGGSNTDATEEYDGSSWTNGGALTQATYEQAGAGTQTAALAFGGQRQPGIIESNTQKYDGSSWTNTGALNSARRFAFGFGIQTAAVAAGGTPPSPASSATEEFDGSSWTTVNSMNTGRRVGGSSGILTAGLAYGGAGGSPDVAQNKTEQYNGTTWSVESTLGTARYNHSGAGTNDTTALYAAGGPPSGLSITEEYTVTVNTITAGAWASGGAMNTGRGTAGDCGTYLAGLVFGGNPGNAPYQVSLTEEYNGTSWSESGDLAQDSADVSGAGTQTAALAFAFSSSPNTITQHYDGSTWTTVPGSLPTAQNQARGIGTQTAAISVGYGSPGTESYEYDGSSWTASGDLNNKRSGQKPAGWGIQTAAILASGYQTPPATIISNTETYDGTSWTETGNSVITPVKRTAATTAGTNSDGMINGGGYEAGSNNSTAATQGYNGTSWFTQPSLATARTNGQGFGTSTNAVACGGHAYPGGTVINATEEFTGETTSLNLKTITDS
jgi:hypothetical protein